MVLYQLSLNRKKKLQLKQNQRINHFTNQVEMECKNHNEDDISGPTLSVVFLSRHKELKTTLTTLYEHEALTNI